MLADLVAPMLVKRIRLWVFNTSAASMHILKSNLFFASESIAQYYNYQMGLLWLSLPNSSVSAV